MDKKALIEKVIARLKESTETSDNLIKEIKNKKLEDTFYTEYKKMTFGPPSEWKEKVNNILTKLLERDINLPSNSLNKIVSKLGI